MSRTDPANLVEVWFLQISWQNGSCKSHDRVVPGNLMTELTNGKIDLLKS